MLPSIYLEWSETNVVQHVIGREAGGVAVSRVDGARTTSQDGRIGGAWVGISLVFAIRVAVFSQVHDALLLAPPHAIPSIVL